MNKNNKNRIILLSFLILNVVSGFSVSLKLGSVGKVKIGLPSIAVKLPSIRPVVQVIRLPSRSVVVVKVNALQAAVNNYKAVTSTTAQRQAWFQEVNIILAQQQKTCNCQVKIYDNMNFYWKKYNEQKAKLEKMKVDKNFAQKYKQLAIKYLKQAQVQEKQSSNMFLSSKKEFDVNTNQLTVGEQLYKKKMHYLDEVWKYELKIRKLKAMVLNFQRIQIGVKMLANKFTVEYEKVMKTINLHNGYKMKYWQSSIEFMKKSRADIVDFNKYVNLYKEYKSKCKEGAAVNWNFNVNINQFAIPAFTFKQEEKKKEVLDLSLKLPKREPEDIQLVQPQNINTYSSHFNNYYLKMELLQKKTQIVKAYYNTNIYRFKHTQDQNIKIKSFLKANDNVEEYLKMQKNQRDFSNTQYNQFSKMLLEVKAKLTTIQAQQKLFISQRKQAAALALNQQKNIYDEAVSAISEILTKIYLYLNTKQDVLAQVNLEGPEFDATFYANLLVRLKKKQTHVLKFRNAYLQYVQDYANQGFQSYARFYANKVQRYNGKLERLERLIGIYTNVLQIKRKL